MKKEIMTRTIRPGVLPGIGETRILEERNRAGNIQKVVLQLKKKIGDAMYTICFFDAAQERVAERSQLTKQAFDWKQRVDLYERSGFHRME